MGLGREPTNSTENTTMVAAIELEVMYCAEKLLGSSNVWGRRRRQGRGRMGSESSRKWGEQKGPSKDPHHQCQPGKSRGLDRVAKCHGYDGYIRVKILASWGKSFGDHANLAKSSLFGGKFVQY